MHPYLITMYVAGGTVVLFLVIYMTIRIYKRTKANKEGDLMISPPRIILTSSSPGAVPKRLYSPRPVKAKERVRSKDEKSSKQKKRERRKGVQSMWLPKRKDTLPITKATIVQPMPMETGQKPAMSRGRLTFSMHYQYKYESNTSSLVVKLLNAQELPPKDSEPLDVFVKTQLVPSKKQLFISKVVRQTLQPYFNEIYEFSIPYEDLQTQKLLFHIIEFDCLSRHRMLGEVRVSLADLGTHGFNVLREVTLCINITKVHGEES